MAGALVHCKEEIEELSERLEWMYNIPFESVPKELVEQLGRYTYEEYLSHCRELDHLLNYWNFAFIVEGQIVAFCWGSYDPLEKLLHVIGLTTHPALFSVRSDFLSIILAKLREIGSECKIYWITHKWKPFLRKFPSELKVSEGKVVEVINV